MLLSWSNLRMALALLRSELFAVYRVHRARVRVLLLLWVLSRAWKPFLRVWVRRLHYMANAERPRLHYQHTSANEQLLARCDLITKGKYCPPWYLPNGHLMTVQLTREDRYAQPIVLYERQILDLPDGGIVSLDWALPPRADHSIPRVSELDPTHRTMLLLPGLTGGSDEYYIRSVVARMVRRHGWQVVVLNSRSCADTPLKTAHLFNCGFTGDVRYVLQQFEAKYRFRESALVVVGFSMGSNVLVKYLGEEGDAALVTAAISVGNPFDLVESARHLSSTFLWRKTYDAALNSNLHDLFFKRSNAHEVFEDDPRVDMEALRATTLIADFDTELTCRTFNYATVHDYYYDASSNRHIANVAVPLLCINAEDDPISTAASIPYAQVKQNPSVILCVTRTGGHLAFYEDAALAEEKNPQKQSTTPVSKTSSSTTTTTSLWGTKVVAEFAESVLHTRTQSAA